jgi:hypothetical protein
MDAADTSYIHYASHALNGSFADFFCIKMDAVLMSVKRGNSACDKHNFFGRN